MAQSSGMAGVRGLLDHPLFLVLGASQGGVLAVAEMVALSRVASGLGGNVGYDGADYRAMAAHVALRPRMDLGTGIVSVWRRPAAVFAVEQELQRAATGWFARGDLRPWRTTVGDDRDSREGAAPGLFGTSLRNAGVERRNRAGCLLWTDCVRGGHGGGYDSDGGSRDGSEIR